MYTIEARNVQEAYVRGLGLVRERGFQQETRNGPALVVPGPVMTVYGQPMERVLLDPTRDANPFFHLLESFWMLAGRNDVASLEPFNGGLKNYSDDGFRYHGAYGHRWRNHFDDDQLQKLITLLREQPTTRQAVLTMWDPEQDLAQVGKDFPCNTQIYFRMRGREVAISDLTPEMVEELQARRLESDPDLLALDMTVCCRSNDAIWGAYGANAVHFSVLLEFVAAAVGVHVGRMYQLSNNLHAYLPALEKVGDACWPVTNVSGHREYNYVRSVPMAETITSETTTYPFATKSTPLFDRCREVSVPVIMADVDDIWRFVQELWSAEPAQPVRMPETHIMSEVGIRTIANMVSAYHNFKQRDRSGALYFADMIPGPDWSRACTEWLERRYAA